MSSPAVDAPRAGSQPVAGAVTQGRVVASEWTKFRSLRSTVWTLVAGVVLTVGIGALLGAVTAAQFDDFDAADRAQFDPITNSLGGFIFAQLAFGILGVLMVTGEYSTGMIRSSLAAVPRRLPVLWAKLGVFAAATFVVSLAAALVSFFLGQFLLGRSDLGVSIGADGALRSVVGAALYVTVAGMMGMGIGALLRSSPGAISVFVGLFFVLPPLTNLLPSSWRDNSVQYLPSNAGQSLWGAGRFLTNALSPWVGFGLLCAYAAVTIAAAAVVLLRRDA